jgi:hypothetical protein
MAPEAVTQGWPSLEPGLSSTNAKRRRGYSSTLSHRLLITLTFARVATKMLFELVSLLQILTDEEDNRGRNL